MLRLILEFYLTLTIPLIYFLGLILIAYSSGNPTSFQAALGLIIVLFGLILWTWVYLTLRSALTVLPKAKKLIITGPYKYFSHPMYLGITFTLLGLSLATGSSPGFLYTIFIIIPLNFFRAKKEEKELTKQFGEKYKDYKKKVLF